MNKVLHAVAMSHFFLKLLKYNSSLCGMSDKVLAEYSFISKRKVWESIHPSIHPSILELIPAIFRVIGRGTPWIGLQCYCLIPKNANLALEGTTASNLIWICFYIAWIYTNIGAVRDCSNLFFKLSFFFTVKNYHSSLVRHPSWNLYNSIMVFHSSSKLHCLVIKGSE